MKLDNINLIMDYFQVYWKYFDINKLGDLLSDGFRYFSDDNKKYNKEEYIKLSDDKFFKSVNLSTTSVTNFKIQEFSHLIIVEYTLDQLHETHRLIADITDICNVIDNKICTITRTMNKK